MNPASACRFLMGLLLTAAAFPAAAAVPQRLNYQGKLANAAGDPLSGTHSFRFKLFAAETGGAALFSEDVAGSDAVSVVNGVYTVQIGSFTAGGIPYGVFEGPDLYLEVDVNAGSTLTGAETLLPRERLNASPWAVHALGAERLGVGASIATFTATGAFQLPSGSTVTSNGTFTISTAASAALTGTPALFINQAGNVGIGTASPGAKLDVGSFLQVRTDNSSPALGGPHYVRGTVGAGGHLVINANNSSGINTGVLYLNYTGDAAGAGQVRIRETVFVNPDGNVGIGTASPAAKLEVTGQAGSPARNLILANSAAEDGATRFIDMIRSGTDSEFLVLNDGRIAADGALSSPADYAEYFYSDDAALKPGELVCLGGPRKVRRCDGSGVLIGVVSTKPGVLGIYADDVTDAMEKYAADPHWVPVGLMGQIPTNVSVSKAPIKTGDQLAMGSDGSAVKGESPRSLLLLALEDADRQGVIRVLVK